MSTSSTPAWRIVASREINVQIRQKSFRISTAITLIVILGGIIIGNAVNNRTTTYDVAVVGDRAAQVVSTAADTAKAADAGERITARTVNDVKAAEKLVADGDVDAAVVPTTGGVELVGDREIDASLAERLQTATSAAALQANADDQGVDLTKLLADSSAEQRLLDPASKDSGTRQAASFVFVILFFLTALGFGMTIATSVAQEKESRVVEILAAAVPIRQLLIGKVVGNTVLAISQVLLYVAAGIAGLVIIDQTSGLSAIAPAMAAYVGFFVLGFGALAALWSVAGSLASRQQDLQSTTLPAQMLLLIPYFVAVTAGEGAKTVLSMVPIISTMLMPSRLAEGSVPLWQLGVGLGGTVLAGILLVRVGARIFERSLLRTGDKIGYREALSLAE